MERENSEMLSFEAFFLQLNSQKNMALMTLLIFDRPNAKPGMKCHYQPIVS